MDNNRAIVFILIGIFVSGGFGYIFGFGIGEQSGYDWGYDIAERDCKKIDTCWQMGLKDAVVFNATVNVTSGATFKGMSCYRGCMHVSCLDNSKVIDVGGCPGGNHSYLDKEYSTWYRTIDERTYKLDLFENIWYGVTDVNVGVSEHE